MPAGSPGGLCRPSHVLGEGGRGGGVPPLYPRPSEVPSPPPVYVEASVVMRAPSPGRGPLLLGSAGILGESV